MTIVPTDSVKVASGCRAREWEIRRVLPYIKTQGLIEPLKLDKNGEIGLRDCWDAARLEACKLLDWSTVIVAH